MSWEVSRNGQIAMYLILILTSVCWMMIQTSSEMDCGDGLPCHCIILLPGNLNYGVL